MGVFQSEGTHAGEFIVREANGDRSREKIVVTSGQVLVAGAVIATVAGKQVEYDNAGASGAEIATGILFDASDATGADADAVGIVRDCTVNLSELVWEAGQDQASIDAGVADLKALGIICR